MKRRLINLLTLLSLHRLLAALAVTCLLLLLVVAVFAVRGFWYSETMEKSGRINSICCLVLVKNSASSTKISPISLRR